MGIGNKFMLKQLDRVKKKIEVYKDLSEKIVDDNSRALLKSGFDKVSKGDISRDSRKDDLAKYIASIKTESLYMIRDIKRQRRRNNKSDDIVDILNNTKKMLYDKANAIKRIEDVYK